MAEVSQENRPTTTTFTPGGRQEESFCRHLERFAGIGTATNTGSMWRAERPVGAAETQMGFGGGHRPPREVQLTRVPPTPGYPTTLKQPRQFSLSQGLHPQPAQK